MIPRIQFPIIPLTENSEVILIHPEIYEFV